MSAPDDWLSLWKVLGARGDPNAIYSNLLAHYSEPHRAYHNLHHISHCLREWHLDRCVLAG
jgi:predicted metal-dependent HD superfamily phosphohydrolase